MQPTAPATATAQIPPVLGGNALGSARSASQVVRGAFGEREVTLQCAVQVQGNTLTVIGVSAMGQRVFTLSYDGDKLTAEASPFVPSGFAPERLLADLELALWPLKSLQAAYAGTPWAVTEPYAGDRRLRRDGKLIAEVHYTGADPWNTRYWISNFEFGYALAVDPQPPDN